MNRQRAIKIAITAMGGQGGGVLSSWIVQLGERNGFIAQQTSVPGVAQRTGATVYYVELFPLAAAQTAGRDPVLALMPSPGDVDIVIAAELMEAGRALIRGFVTSKTTLIASTHRDYAISEKISLGDGRQSSDTVLKAAKEAAGKFIGADMAIAATDSNAVISAVLFGALAGSKTLPFERSQFEDTIRKMRRAVDANLRGFARGYDIALSAQPKVTEENITEQHKTPAPSGSEPLLSRVHEEFPDSTHFYMHEGLKRTVDYQDILYGHEYLDRLKEVLDVDNANGGSRRDYELTRVVAKHLALWMTYEDAIRVADLKTRSKRFARFRNDVCAESEQIIDVYEFMRPRVEEFCDLLPTGLAKMVLETQPLNKVVSFLLGEGRRVPTTKLRGFLPLYFIASLRFLRRSSYRFDLECARMKKWLASVQAEAAADYALAVEIAKTQRLIKGYGETHERGLDNFNSIIIALPQIKKAPNPAAAMAGLVEAALKDVEGVAFGQALNALKASSRDAA